MKTIAFLFSAFLTLSAFSQQVGVKAGLALVTYNAKLKPIANPSSSSVDRSVTFKPGLVLGSFLDFGLNEQLLLRSGAELVVKGGTETGVDVYNGTAYPYSYSTNFAAVDFPFLLLYKTGATNEKGWLFGGGLVPGILIEGGLRKGDLGASLLAGYQFRNGLHYSLAYNHGLINVATANHYSYQSLRNRHVALTLGYRFRPSSSARSEPVVKAVQPPTEFEAARSLYAELGGSGGFLSVNYDTRLTKSNKGWGIRFGFGAITDLNSVGFTVPFGLNYLAGERAHFFEMGVGATYFSFGERNQDSWFSFQNLNFLAPYIWTGYRYQPPDKRFLFRAGFNQFMAAGLGGFIRYPFPGFSFGYSLK